MVGYLSVTTTTVHGLVVPMNWKAGPSSLEAHTCGEVLRLSRRHLSETSGFYTEII